MKDIEITKIYSTFKHQHKFYFVFNIKGSEYEYLYFFNPDNQNRSLLFGDNLHLLIKKQLKNPELKCIECQLGIHVRGAISLDQGDIITSNISIGIANQILEKLRIKVGETNEFIHFF